MTKQKLIEILGYAPEEGQFTKTSAGGWVEKTAYVEKPENIEGIVSGNACVSGNAHVTGYAHVYGDACVYGDARVYGNARISGGARVSGDAHVTGGEWKTSPLYIQGSLHACTNSKPGYIQIGCKELSFAEWKEKGREIGLSEDMTEEQIEEYLRIVALFIRRGK